LFKESNPNLFKGGIAISLAVLSKPTRRKTKSTRLDMFGDQCVACGMGLLLSMDNWLNHMIPSLLIHFRDFGSRTGTFISSQLKFCGLGHNRQ
jgi:hypothetical protein